MPESSPEDKKRKTLHLALIAFDTVAMVTFAAVTMEYFDSFSDQLDWEAKGAIIGGIFVAVLIALLLGSAVIYQRITGKLSSMPSA